MVVHVLDPTIKRALFCEAWVSSTLLLKRAEFMPKDLLGEHTCNIRWVSEFAVQVWQDIPAYFADAI